jgi:PhoH-like ATPase
MAPFSLKDSHVVMPQIVIQEIDKKKNSADSQSAGYNARAFSRYLKKFLKEQQSTELFLPNNSILTIQNTKPQAIKKVIEKLGLASDRADSEILATAWLLKQDNDQVVLLTNDTNLFTLALAIGLDVEDFQVNHKFQDIYSGVKVLEVDDEQVITDFYQGNKIYLSEDIYPGLYPNQILVIKSTYSRHSSLLASFQGYDQPLRRLPNKDQMSFAGIAPLNKEQGFAYDLLEQPEIYCVTLAGRAGTGKSIVALSYGIEMLNREKFEKIIVLKTVVPVGKDLGFLPGTLEEKLNPWMESFRDSLDIIMQSDDYEKDGFKIKERPYEQLIRSGKLEFHPLTFMRGRSIRNTLIILDECQNSSKHEVKTLLTRLGEGSKVILMGDIEQIDVPYLDRQNNGLSYVIERGKDTKFVGHITFIKACRSDFAEWASDNL